MAKFTIFQSSSGNWKASGTYSGPSRDTEVIIHGYKQWGDDVLNHLNGMFGLAIWDVRKQRLVVARDPFGIKLIYYRIDKGSVSFGSEIRAVVAAKNERAEVDPVSLNLFLRYRYTPSPFTIFSGVQKAGPGNHAGIRKGQLQLAALVSIQAHTIFAGEVR